jgi:hypothetical protein
LGRAKLQPWHGPFREPDVEVQRMSDDSTSIPELTPIPDWLGYYLSRDGRLWSTVYRGSRGVPRARKLSRYGRYVMATLYDTTNGRTWWVRFHRLMLMVFVGPCPPGMDGCHYDDIHTNNHIDNLRWDYPVANAADRDRNGKTHRGENNSVSLLTDAQVIEIRGLLAAKVRQIDIADRYGISQQTVSTIACGRRAISRPPCSPAD